MASRTSLRLKVLSPCSRVFFNLSSRSSSSSSSYSKVYFLSKNNNPRIRNCSARATGARSSLPPPDVANLAQTARISLAPNENLLQKFDKRQIGTLVFPPRMSKMNAIDNLLANWKPRFGQLQAIDLDSVEPAIRADTVHYNLSEDITEKFENREEITASIPKVTRIHTSKFPKYLTKPKSDSPWPKELKCTYNLPGPERSLFEMERQE